LNKMLFKRQNIKKITIDVDGTALEPDDYTYRESVEKAC